MKLYELYELIPEGQSIALIDDEYRIVGEYDGKNSIEDIMNEMDVFNITAEDSTIKLQVEVPTKTVRFEGRAVYIADIEVEVPFNATDDEIIDILDDRASDIGGNLPYHIDSCCYGDGDYDFTLDDTEFDTRYYEVV